MSNELEVALPLDTALIRLPPPEVRVDDDDLYREYVEIREGAGIVPYADQGEWRNSAVVIASTGKSWWLKECRWFHASARRELVDLSWKNQNGL